MKKEDTVLVDDQCVPVGNPAVGASLGNLLYAIKLIDLDVNPGEGGCNSGYAPASLGMGEAIQIFVCKVLFLGMCEPPEDYFGCAPKPE